MLEIKEVLINLYIELILYGEYNYIENPNKKTNKVVYSQRPVPEAKTSMKKKKVEVSYSRFMNENMQTDWNSFDIEEWELDPDA